MIDEFDNRRKALFLDRDGVINFDTGYVHTIEEFKFTPWIFELCEYFQKLHYLIFIVTNQSGVARGYFTKNDYFRLMKYVIDEFDKHNIYILDIQQCFELDSPMRKPNPGMFIALRDKWNIDMENSISIGDKESDFIAAKAAGIKTHIFVNYNI